MANARANVFPAALILYKEEEMECHQVWKRRHQQEASCLRWTGRLVDGPKGTSNQHERNENFPQQQGAHGERPKYGHEPKRRRQLETADARNIPRSKESYITKQYL